MGNNRLTENGDQGWNIANILMKNLQDFLNAKKFFTCWATLTSSRELVCVTKWQVDKLIVSVFLVVVTIEHARFEIDLAVFKSSGMLQYGNSK